MIIPNGLLSTEEEFDMISKILDATRLMRQRLTDVSKVREWTSVELEYFHAHVALSNRWSELYEALEAACRQAAAPPALPGPDDHHALLGSQQVGL